jgi:hypothetical protein
MSPIAFPEHNVVLGAQQPEYLPLPAHRSPDGHVVTCWKLTWRERFKVLFVGKVWSHQLTFNRPLQPQLLEASYPFSVTKQ